jgi:hypothetical protein
MTRAYSVLLELIHPEAVAAKVSDLSVDAARHASYFHELTSSSCPWSFFLSDRPEPAREK